MQSPALAATLEDLTTVARRLGRYDDAVARGQEAVRVSAMLGADHPAVATARVVLGAAYSDRGSLAEALHEFETALASDRLAGADRKIAGAESDVAAVLTRAGRATEAVPHYLAAIAAFERLSPPGQAATARENLAVTYLDLGQTADAEPLLRVVLSERERAVGPDHPTTSHAHELLARAATSAGNLAEADRQLQLAERGYEHTFGRAHPSIADVLARRAELERDRGRTTAALALDGRVLAMREQL
ncbi:MAG: tetratricopeptide repeat protein, partial [Proteobacteria bacterium]|nr:tetratricopeptide repeat protein [Pseudomonadota bacterium]